MLVLSRRCNQSVVFPSLGISVRVLETKGVTVRLGIDAPPHVEILREELVGKVESAPAKPSEAAKSPNWSHEQRGRLNTAVMGLYVVEKQLQLGSIAEAEATLKSALQVLESLDLEIGADANARRQLQPSRRIQALLVEDDLNEEALLASYLRMSGFDIQTAHDGYEAMEFLSHHERPDFVLLDMRLPRFDGPATIAEIRKNPAFNGVRIFAVSGSSREEISVLSAKEKIDGWFQKPLNPARIAEAMSAAMSN